MPLKLSFPPAAQFEANWRQIFLKFERSTAVHVRPHARGGHCGQWNLNSAAAGKT
jgi:hypothetical protein